MDFTLMYIDVMVWYNYTLINLYNHSYEYEYEVHYRFYQYTVL